MSRFLDVLVAGEGSVGQTRLEEKSLNEYTAQ
jgi:hypothetical protein